MQVFYSETHRQHDPSFEVVDGGQHASYLEDPGRIDSILAALRKAPWVNIQKPADFGLDPIRAVHTSGYLEFLAAAWEEWRATLPDDQQAATGSALLPATFALRRQPHIPASILGRAGYYVMDLSAVIVAGTHDSALASANCALSAAQAVSEDHSRGPSAFALCRPPGHHAGFDYAAGYCFINNAAVAAEFLSARGNVAVLDIDYHAGNGTQDIFYQRNDVLTISLHADPAWEYPYYAGYADETGAGSGLGFHRNFPLPAGTNDARYLEALDEAIGLVRDFAPRYMVVSLGMDTYEKDALGRFRLTTEGIHSIGERIARLRLPTAIILEGGYNNADLGRNVVSFLSSFAS